MFDFNKKELEKKLNGNSKELKVSNIMKNLDYETYIKMSSENNPAVEFIDPKEALTEEDFDEIKSGLTAAAMIAGLKSAFEIMGNMFKGLAEIEPDDEDGSDDLDLGDLVRGFSKIDVSDAKPESKNEKRIKLTGEPAIDTEIIFNLIKNHTK